MISVRCSSCGEPHKLRDELAGKRVRCKSCDEVVSVPDSTSRKSSASAVSRRKSDGDSSAADDGDGQFDDLFEAQNTRRTVKAKPRRRSSSSSASEDADVILWWFAIPFRIIGVISLLLYVCAIAGCLMSLQLIGLLVYGVPLLLTVLGIKGAAGKGIPIGPGSRLEGTAGIFTGMTLIFIANPIVIVLLVAKGAGVNFGIGGQRPIVNVPQPVNPQIIQQPAPLPMNPFPGPANALPNNAANNIPALPPQVPLAGANALNNPPRPINAGGAISAPRPGQRVAVLRFQSFSGMEATAANAAADALRTVSWADAGTLAVSFPAKTIVIATVGGSINTGEASIALQKAGFQIAPGVQLRNFSEDLLAAAPAQADLPGFGSEAAAAPNVSAPFSPKNSTLNTPRNNVANDNRPLTLKKKYGVPVADRGARLVVPDLPSDVVMFDGTVYDTKNGERLGRFADEVRGRNTRFEVLSADGRFLARVAGTEQTTIDLFERDVDGPPRVISFEKYKKPTLRFLTFVAADRMLAGAQISPDFQSVSIRLPEGRLGADFKVEHAGQHEITVSADGKFLAVVSVLKFEVFDIAKGQRVAFMSTPNLQGLPFAMCNGVAFSPGSQEIAAILRGQHIVVWSQRGKVIDEIPIPMRMLTTREGRQSLAWLPDKSGWIVGGQLVVDRELRAPIAEIKAQPKDSGEPGVWLDQQTVLMPYEPNRKPELAAFEIPWDELRERIAELNADKTLLLRPGQSLSLQVDVGVIRFGDTKQTRDALEAAWIKRLATLDLKVAEAQPIVLRVAYSEAAGKAGRVISTVRGSTPLTLTETEGRLEMSLNVRDTNAVCWSDKRQSNSGLIVSEEPTEANLRKQTFNSVLNTIDSMNPPRYINKDGKPSGLPILLQP